MAQNITARNVEIDTSRFYRSHMKNPSGRGGWLFENYAGEVVFSHNDTYSEAKKAAKQWAAANGVPVLFTCP